MCSLINRTNLSTEGYTNLEMCLNELAGDPMPWETGSMTLRKAAESFNRFLLTARGLSVHLPVGARVRVD